MLESAAESPEFGARYLTLNTLDGDIAWDAEYWKALGHATPERSNEAWYLRLGFEVFRRGVPRYEDIAPRTGVPILHNAVVRTTDRVQTSGSELTLFGNSTCASY